MKKHIKLLLLLVFTLFIMQCSKDETPIVLPEIQTETPPETVTDIDGNEYNTITMGDQIWTLENLKTTTFNDGTPITIYTFGNDWPSYTNQTPFYQWASTEDLSNIIDEELPFDYYGAMYNHFAIETGKLAPEGWRIPTKEDFEELESYVASQGFAGNEATALKTETGWSEFTGAGTNDFGFNALPNGYVSGVGTPTAGEATCTWATSTIIEGTSIGTTNRVIVFLSDESTIQMAETPLSTGVGVRLIKIQ